MATFPAKRGNASNGPDSTHPEDSGSEKGIFWKRGLFRKVHFLENLEILEITFREFSDCGNERRFRPSSRESRDFRDSQARKKNPNPNF